MVSARHLRHGYSDVDIIYAEIDQSCYCLWIGEYMPDPPDDNLLFIPSKLSVLLRRAQADEAS